MLALSVIIPVYNGETTIQETIDSVLQQTFSDFELIVINDGSTDATLTRLEVITDPRLSVFSYPNAGLAESRNRGLAIAQGEFVAFLDADDLWTPDKLEAQWKALQAYPEAAVAYSWTNYINDTGQFVKIGKHITANGDVFAKLLVDNFLENGSNPLIRKEALSTVGGFDSSINSVADWDMYLRLAKRYHFIAVPSPQILYRLSSSSMSTHILQQETQSLKVIDRAFADVPESLRSLKKESLANLYKYLTFKAIQGYPSRKNGIAAVHCFWNYVRYNPTLLQQPRVILGVLLKIGKMLVMSPDKNLS